MKEAEPADTSRNRTEPPQPVLARRGPCGQRDRCLHLLAVQAAEALAVVVLLLHTPSAAQTPHSVPQVLERFVAIDNVCAWPNLTLLKDGTIAAVIYNRPSHLVMEGGVECWGSTDDGRSWKKRGQAAPPEPRTARANVAAGLAHNGDLIVLSSGWGYAPLFRDRRLPPWVSRSSDGGRNWRINRDRDAVVFPAGADYDDRGERMIKPFGDIVALPDGRLAASLYHDYCSGIPQHGRYHMGVVRWRFP
ncbi:MAG TPA: sialidase family protein [Phycisphaerae bacterium]|nr:sialidase family protein [Phycisphaerae bacterium]HRY70459.1 sialidase family protein [Phycisphaerae bacterium]HSA27693.1 sialidase family protein [Phycisphaerae bacterium]